MTLRRETARRRALAGLFGLAVVASTSACAQQPLPAPPVAQEADAQPPPSQGPEGTEVPELSEADQDEDGLHRLSERPDFPQLEARTQELDHEYHSAYGDGSIYELTPAEEDYLGEHYVWAFVSEVNEYYAETLNADEIASAGPAELDEYIEHVLQHLDELEQRFTQGRLLNVPAEDPDDWYEYDNRHPEFYEREEQAAAYSPQLGSDGTYWAAGEELAEIFGLEVEYDFDEVVCLDIRDNTRDTGYYCEATPEVIYLNSEHIYIEDNMRHVWWYELVRHEIAHHQIHMKCGSVSPQIAEGQVEAVTSAYAVLFLGADRETLELGEEPGSEYLMAEESFEIAQAIGDEYCFELP